MKKGLRPVPDHVLERLLELATDDDLARVLYLAQYVDHSRIRSLDVDRIARLVVIPSGSQTRTETGGQAIK